MTLAQTLADAPDMILQRLAETALQLCRADTAGISLLDEKDGAEVFRWEALAGVFSDRLNATMPRNASPCGTTIDRNATQLMYMAERIFPALKVGAAHRRGLAHPVSRRAQADRHGMGRRA